MQKFVYDFEEGNRDLKDLLGGKGANLAEMTNLGLPVPPGATNRGFTMSGGQPEPGKAAPPADQAPTTKPKAKEGTLWNTGNNIFR